MKNKLLPPIKRLLLSSLLLAWAGSAWAATYTIDSETLWSTLVPQPTASDDVVIINGATGGKLWVDVANAACRNLTVGASGSYGVLQFGTAAATLTVNGDLSWGGSVSGNTILMSGATDSAHTLVLKGNVLTSGAGTFTAGLGEVQYTKGGAQNVGAFIYKHLTLGNSGAKTLNGGITVNGNLKLEGTATVTGGSVTYGSLATLTYNQSSGELTTSVEFPSTMAKNVTVAGGTGIKLAADKTMTAGTLTINSGKRLNLDTRTLTLQNATVVNNGADMIGTGKIVLNGGAGISGSGKFGNVEQRQDWSAPSGIQIAGVLTIISPNKITLTGTGNNAGWLYYGSPLVHRAAGAYNSGSDSSVFAGGTLNVGSDANAAFSNLKIDGGTAGANATKEYGTASVAISGTVSATFGSFGSKPAESGKTVTVVINGVTQTATTDASGNFSISSFNIQGFAVNTSSDAIPDYVITYKYPTSDNNVAPVNPDNTSTKLFISQKSLLLIAQNASKYYGDADPVIVFTANGVAAPYAGVLIGSDAFSGNLAYSGGIGAGTHPINDASGLTITNLTGDVRANYAITLVDGSVMSILPKLVTITPDAKTKVYGESDPALTYRLNGFAAGSDGKYGGVLVNAGDFSGGLIRAQAGTAAGEHVGTYAIQNTGAAPVAPINANYVASFDDSKSLQITPLAIVVTPANWATNANPSSIINGKVYGMSDPVLQYTYAPALLFGDAFKAPNSVLKRAAGETAGTAVGTDYDISGDNLTIGVGGAGGPDSSDYSVTVATGKKFRITRKNVQVVGKTTTINYGDSFGKLDVVNFQGGLAFSETDNADITLSPTLPAANVAPGTPAYNPTLAATSTGNYWFSIGASPNNKGVLNINKAVLTVRADNKAKKADGIAYSPFTVTYEGLKFTDAISGNTQGPVSGAISGTLFFSGSAVLAVAPNVYYNQIQPNISGFSSSRYTLATAPGTLTLAAPIGTTTATGPITWAHGGSFAWEINKADAGAATGLGLETLPGGAGQNPGWNLYHVNGTLDVTASFGNRFQVNLVTIVPNSDSVPGLMAKFDPTRAWAWKFVEATDLIFDGGAGSFSPDRFLVNSEGVGLFANPTFGGTFSVSNYLNALYVTFTPGSHSLVDVNDTVAPLLASVTSGDLPALYLENAGTPPFNPNNPVVLNLKVKNLQANAQPYVVGAQAYVKYDSTIFSTVPTVAPGDTIVWKNIIATNWNTSGDLDMVLGVSLTILGGTKDDATIATITLTPKRTKTANSRVVFREDVGLTGNPDWTGINAFTDIDGRRIRPARVMSEVLPIIVDETGPVLGTITATQDQPYVGSQPVKSTGTVVRGRVNISVVAKDTGVGLVSAPTIQLTGPATPPALTCSNPSVPAVGEDKTFNYFWDVDGSTVNGTYTATVTAEDRISPTPNQTTTTFTLEVNNRQVVGVVELESFTGTDRMVTFVAGYDNDHKVTRNIPLNFVSSTFMPGSLRNREAFATELNAPTVGQTASAFLVYGDILNLQPFVTKLMGSTKLASDLRAMWFGDIAWATPPTASDLDTLARTLANPVRTVDFFVQSKLEAGTIVALNAYLANSNAPNAGALKTALLNDFNKILINGGTNIYNALRFAEVTLTPAADARKNVTSPARAVAEANRFLLNAAFPQFAIASLHPQVPAWLLSYVSGANQTLKAALLADLNLIEAAGVNLYTAAPARFFDVTLRPGYANLLPPNPSPTGTELTRLNRLLLEDGLANAGALNYVSAPLSAATMATVTAYLGNKLDPTAISNFETALFGDLNTLISGGSLIYTGDRFGDYVGGSPDILAGIANPPTGSALVHLNHRILEESFVTVLGEYLLSKGVLVGYTLTAVPAGTTKIQAKTAWSLQKVLDISLSANEATANFINDGVAAWSSSDAYLRAGDIDGSNSVNLLDYNKLRSVYNNVLPNWPQADIDGNGRAFSEDYDLLRANWLQTGDPNFY